MLYILYTILKKMSIPVEKFFCLWKNNLCKPLLVENVRCFYDSYSPEKKDLMLTLVVFTSTRANESYLFKF